MTHAFPTRRSSDLHEEHEDDQQQPEQDHVDLRRIGPKHLRQQGQEQRAEQRTARVVGAADDRDGDDGERDDGVEGLHRIEIRSEQHTSELQSLMRISYAVFCWKKNKKKYTK